MSLKLLHTGAPLTNAVISAPVPAGNYSKFFLRIHGENVDEKTVLRSTIGNVLIFRKDQQISHLPFNFISLRSDQKFGFSRADSTEDSSFAFAAMIDMALDGLPNAMDIKDNGECYFRFQFDTAATGIGNATTTESAIWELYGVEDSSVVESYQLTEHTAHVDGVGAGLKTVTLDGRNIARLGFLDAGAVVSNLEVEVDGKVVFAGNDQALIEFSNLMNKLESVGTIGEVNLTESGDISDAINKNVTLRITFSGAGTLEVFVTQVEFDNVNVQASLSRAQSVARMRLTSASKSVRAKVAAVSPLLSVNPNRFVTPN
jgi:hypothetical protein